MIDNEFKSRLTRLSSKKVNDRVVQEVALTYTSSDTLQNFVEGFDKYGTDLKHYFTPNDILWKSINFDVKFPNVHILFDNIEFDADIVGIKVNRKDTMDGEIFTYTIVFNKAHNPDIDTTFAITYLGRKEENDDGKKVFLEYDTIITDIMSTETMSDIVSDLRDNSEA